MALMRILHESGQQTEQYNLLMRRKLFLHVYLLRIICTQSTVTAFCKVFVQFACNMCLSKLGHCTTQCVANCIEFENKKHLYLLQR